MGRLVVSMYVSLDGVVEDPGGAEDFEHGGWSRPYFDQDAALYAREQLFASDALLLGRLTYQSFAEAWPSMTDESGFAERMNSLPKYVASASLTSLDEADWNATLLGGDVAEQVAELKRPAGRNILVYGSTELVQTLIRHDLVDEYRLWLHPVVLGSGKRLVRDHTSLTLRPIDAKAFGSGVVLLSYRHTRRTAATAAAR
jgi:dihydrofolate reductase